jgi:hypothetical protein
VARTAFAWEAHVAVRKAGLAQHAIRELATPAVPNTGPARMASVNAARGGMESTALLVGQLHLYLFIYLFDSFLFPVLGVKAGASCLYISAVLLSCALSP